MAHGVLVPRPGIEPTSLALQGRFFNHWTTREVPAFMFFKRMNMIQALVNLDQPPRSGCSEEVERGLLPGTKAEDWGARAGSGAGGRWGC